MDFLSSILMSWLCLDLQPSVTELTCKKKKSHFHSLISELGEIPHLSLTKLSRRIICLDLGQVTTVVVSSASLAKDILWTYDQMFSNRTLPDERFLLSENETDVMGRNFELIPFGDGRRICPLLSLTMRMLQLMLGSLINCFDWKLEDGVVPETMNIQEKFGLTLEMAHPLRAVPKKS